MSLNTGLCGLRSSEWLMSASLLSQMEKVMKASVSTLYPGAARCTLVLLFAVSVELQTRISLLEHLSASLVFRFVLLKALHLLL